MVFEILEYSYGLDVDFDTEMFKRIEREDAVKDAVGRGSRRAETNAEVFNIRRGNFPENFDSRTFLIANTLAKLGRSGRLLRKDLAQHHCPFTTTTECGGPSATTSGQTEASASAILASRHYARNVHPLYLRFFCALSGTAYIHAFSILYSVILNGRVRTNSGSTIRNTTVGELKARSRKLL